MLVGGVLSVCVFRNFYAVALPSRALWSTHVGFVPFMMFGLSSFGRGFWSFVS